MAEADRHGVFISWSKSVSAEVAKHLKPFLEDVLGTATIFMSQAMEGGTRWAMEIPQHLESCNAGLVVVTRENRHEPWLHFEAGALSKHIDGSRVVPLLCGASVGDIQGTPLSLFQAKNFDHDDFLAVCVAFGASFGVPEEAVRRRFEKSWPDLEAAVAPITKKNVGPNKELGLTDIMSVMERVAGQVASIDASLKSTSAPRRTIGSLGSTLMEPYSNILHLRSSEESPKLFLIDVEGLSGDYLEARHIIPIAKKDMASSEENSGPAVNPKGRPPRKK